MRQGGAEECQEGAADCQAGAGKSSEDEESFRKYKLGNILVMRSPQVRRRGLPRRQGADQEGKRVLMKRSLPGEVGRSPRRLGGARRREVFSGWNCSRDEASRGELENSLIGTNGMMWHYTILIAPS